MANMTPVLREVMLSISCLDHGDLLHQLAVKMCPVEFADIC